MRFLYVLFIYFFTQKQTLVFIHYSLYKQMVLSKSIDTQFKMSLSYPESYHYYQRLWAHHKSAFQHKLSSVVMVRAIVNNMNSYHFENSKGLEVPTQKKGREASPIFLLYNKYLVAFINWESNLTFVPQFHHF